MNGQIFISYRREESRWSARSLHDRLSGSFGPKQIFMDIDAIALGEDFVKAIETTVAKCDVLIAVIGNNWLTSKDDKGLRRLDSPEDFVRMEIATALRRDIRVIPVLVDGVSMPRSADLPDDLKPLVRRNALQISDTSFDGDCQRLVDAIEQVLEPITALSRDRKGKERLEDERRRRKEQIGPKAVVVGIVAIAACVVYFILLPRPKPMITGPPAVTSVSPGVSITPRPIAISPTAIQSLSTHPIETPPLNTVRAVAPIPPPTPAQTATTSKSPEQMLTASIAPPADYFPIDTQTAQILQKFPKSRILLDKRFSSNDKKAEYAVTVVNVRGIQPNDRAYGPIPFPSAGKGESMQPDKDDPNSVNIEASDYTRYLSRTYSPEYSTWTLWEYKQPPGSVIKRYHDPYLQFKNTLFIQ
jgi:hypothetical protein